MDPNQQRPPKRKSIAEYFSKIDELIRARYFPDPVAWEIIETLDLHTRAQIIAYASYRLACEIEHTEPLSRSHFYRLDRRDFEDAIDQAFFVILFDDSKPFSRPAGDNANAKP